MYFPASIGFALVEKAVAKLPELVNDALNDLAAISQIGENEDEDLDNSAESDFFHIVEYVRLAAMNIFMEYAVVVDAPQEKLKTKPADGEYLATEKLFKGRQIH